MRNSGRTKLDYYRLRHRRRPKHPCHWRAKEQTQTSCTKVYSCVSSPGITSGRKNIGRWLSGLCRE